MILLDSVVLFLRYRPKLRFTLMCLSILGFTVALYFSWSKWIYTPLVKNNLKLTAQIKQAKKKVNNLKKPKVGKQTLVFMKEDFLSGIAVNTLIHQALADIKDLSLLSFEQKKTQIKNLSFFSDVFVTGVRKTEIHPFKVELIGSYRGFLTVLERLQTKTKGLFWQKADYHVKNYPQGHITLEFYSVGKVV